MKRFVFILIASLLIGAACSACTPGALSDIVNKLGVSPGNARIVTRGNAPAPRIVTRSNAG